MALAPGTADRIARRWAERLGCSPAAFREPGVTIAEGTGPQTVRLLRRGDALVVGAPETVRDALAAHRGALGGASLPATAQIERALAEQGVAVAAAHGPQFLGYVDGPGFSPVDSDARLLASADEPSFARLRDRVPASEWARTSPTFRPGRTAGLFHDGALVAAATLADPPLPDVGVVVAPAHRGRGHGRAVVSRLTAAFDADPDAVLRYRTPEASAASVALAESLGYERWARTAVIVLDRS